LREQGFKLIAGVDEAGRGPLAGPVVAAAVIFDASGDYPRETSGPSFKFADDSKKMTPAQREKAFWVILKKARAVSIGLADQTEIDRINILRATLQAMTQAVSRLEPRPDFILIDGRETLPAAWPQKAVIGGDARVPVIGAASIVAKVVRDRIMIGLDKAYPGYGFARHKGYGTPDHLKALSELGVCDLHRLTFGPCAALRRRP